MASSLASQLANIGTLDRDRLQASTSKFRPSFLFPPRQAASLSNEDIHSLAYNGYLALLAQDSRFERFENTIFGEKAKVTDRTILTKDENVKLDEALNGLLRLLASRFLLKSTGKVLEWLIRRFRINDFNVDEVLLAILPYHETPQFAQMLQIVKLDDAKFQAFQAVKTSLQPMPRQHLLTAMSKSHDLFRFVATSVEPYRNQACLYSTLTAFWAGSILAYFERVKQVHPQDMAVLLPVIVAGIKSDDRDLRLGSYIILSHLATRAELSQETATLLSETMLISLKNLPDSEEIEAALTTLAIVSEHQTASMPTFSAKAAQLPLHVLDSLIHLAQKSNISALLQPLLPPILAAANKQGPLARHLLDILAAPACPEQVTQVAVRYLLETSKGEAPPSPDYLKMLNSVEQRLPEGVSLLSYAANSKDAKILRLVNTLDTAKSAAAQQPLQHRDATIRAERLRQILQTPGQSSQAEMHSAILEALSDSSPQVAEAVHSEQNAAILRDLSAQQSIQVLERCLVGATRDIPVTVFILRAKFLLHTFSRSASSDLRYRILTEYLWPHLLASKGNLEKISQLSPILADADNIEWPSFKQHKWSQIITENEAGAYNDKLAETLGNLFEHLDQAKQEQFASFLKVTAGIAAAASGRGKSSALSILVVLRSLAKGNSRFAATVLKRVPPATFLGKATTQYGTASISSSLAHRIWSKPLSAKTLSMLRASVFCTAMHSVAANDAKLPWQWLASTSDLAEGAIRHRALVNRVYELAHLSTIHRETKTTILQSLYKDQASRDALAFLAAVYTSTRGDILRVIALHDAGNIIKACPEADYQTVVPSLLVALASGKPAVCQAALHVMRCISDSQAQSKPGFIYGFDALYGKQSVKMQYLNTQQLSHLLQAILREGASLLVDGSYVQQILVNAVETGDSEAKRATCTILLSYIVSHAEAWRNMTARSVLISMVQRIMDEKRSSLFQAFISEALYSETTIFPSATATETRNYWNLIFRSLKTRSTSDDSLQLVIRALRDTREGVLSTSLRAEARGAVSDWMLQMATHEQRLEIFEVASGLVRDSKVSETAHNIELVRCCLQHADVLQSAIESARDGVSQNVSEGQVAKKAKSGSQTLLNVELARIGLVLENTDVAAVPGSMELLTSFLSLLASLVDLSASHIDVDYYLQLTATRASELASSIQETVEESDLRVGAVLETIRISNNPATSNAALNLMADLAKLAPAQVAQNVMPIFTFMGTNILQRDDAQSTRVVDKTLRTIVPALVAQRRQRSKTREEMVHGMDEVLRIFVDAASHVPRHRRLHLFIRFVDILGPEDFLGPICTLMVDKTAAKYVKSRDASLISLPVGLYQHFSGLLQLSAINDQLLELQEKVDLLNAEVTEGSISSRHSSPVTPAESPMLPIQASRRTVLALLFFIQEILTSKKLSVELQRARSAAEASIETKLVSITKACLHFVNLKAQRLAATDVTHLSAGSQALVRALTRLMNTAEFVVIVQMLLGYNVAEISDMAIDLLVERLASVKPAHRLLLGPAITSSLVYLSSTLTTTDSKSKRLHALLRLRAVAGYCAEEEVAQLYSTLMSVLDMAEKSTSTTFSHQAVVLIMEASPRLGGRIIPAVHRLIKLLGSLIRQNIETLSTSASRNVIVTAFGGFEVLLQCAPTFVAKELRTVLDLCVTAELAGNDKADSANGIKAAAAKVVSACTKKLPPQALYQAIQELYTQHSARRNPAIEGVVAILAQTIRHTSTRTVADMHKALFGQLLRILDARSIIAEDEKLADKVEKASIGAFMQLALKLNEATFRPLFMRLVDWTSPESPGISQRARELTFFKIMDRMLVQLKAIAAPYYGLAIDLTIQVMTGDSDEKLWQTAVSSLRRALDADATSFWTETRLNKFAAPLAEQGRRNFIERPAVLDTYCATVRAFSNTASTHFNALQSLHQALLRLAREDSQSAQLAAIRALQAMWDSEAQPELIAFKPESMPTIAELLETGGQVEQETKKLLATMAEGEEDAEMALDEEEASDDGADSDEDQ